MQGEWNDDRLELLMSNLLRAGVMSAAAVVLAGGIAYLAQHGRQPVSYRQFHGEPEQLKSLGGIVSSAIHLHTAGIVQLGVLLLIATPVMRVAFAVVAFFLERDYMYTVVSLIVLAILLYSIVGHAG
jgi:uncharacterized membrane protein